MSAIRICKAEQLPIRNIPCPHCHMLSRIDERNQIIGIAAEERGGRRGRGFGLPIKGLVGFLNSFSGLSLGVYLVQKVTKAIMNVINMRVHDVMTNQYFASQVWTALE